MDTVAMYLERVPLPVLILAPVMAVAAFLVVPARWRMPTAITFVVFWLPLSEYHELGIIQALAKSTGFAAYILLAVAAWLDPGPTRRLPLMAWLYPATAVLGFVYIWGVSDLELALVIRVQWLLLVIAAISVARTIVDQASLLRVVGAITIGLAICVCVPLSNIVLHPGEAIRGPGRFSPYGMDPNHVGVLFALAAPLSVYAAVRAKRMARRALQIVIAAAAIVMALLTASRSTMAVMFGAFLPLVWVLTRRPLVTMLGAAVVVGGLSWAVGHVGKVKFERFTTLETGRTVIAADYAKVIAARPIFGLLGTEGESFLGSQFEMVARGNPHNGYLEVLYLGGLSYGIPVFSLVAYTSWCVVRAWRQRTRIDADPLLVTLLAAFMVMTYAHGFVNRSLYYPTVSLSMFHVLLSTFFMGVAADLRQTGRALVLPDEGILQMASEGVEPLAEEASPWAA